MTSSTSYLVFFTKITNKCTKTTTTCVWLLSLFRDWRKTSFFLCTTFVLRIKAVRKMTVKKREEEIAKSNTSSSGFWFSCTVVFLKESLSLCCFFLYFYALCVCLSSRRDLASFGLSILFSQTRVCSVFVWEEYSLLQLAFFFKHVISIFVALLSCWWRRQPDCQTAIACDQWMQSREGKRSKDFGLQNLALSSQSASVFNRSTQESSRKKRRE